MNIKQYKSIILGLLCFVTLQASSQLGKVIIQSDATGTGSLIVGSENSTLTVEVNRYIPSTNWHIISSASSGQELGAFVTSNSIKQNSTYLDYDLAPYDEETDSWSPYTEGDDTGLMVVAKGYSTRRSEVGSVKFSGTINQGTINTSITKSGGTGYGWNAIGNPFTSTIKAKGANGFLIKNLSALDESFAGIYVWDQSINSGNGDYVVIAEAGFNFPAPGGEAELSQNNLAVGQGFIVKAKENGTVTFDSLMQAHSDTIAIPFKSGEISWPAIRLSVTANENINKTVIAFNNGMTKGIDPMYDVGKLKGNPGFALYTQLLENNNIDFAVQALPLKDFELYRIPVGLGFSNGGEVTFSVEMVNLPVGMQFFLEDTKTKTFTPLNNMDSKYTTIVKSGNKGFGRFYLLTSDALVTNTSEIEKQEFDVFVNNRMIYVNGQTERNTLLSVYGIDGRLYYQKIADANNQNTIDMRIKG